MKILNIARSTLKIIRWVTMYSLIGLMPLMGQEQIEEDQQNGNVTEEPAVSVETEQKSDQTDSADLTKVEDSEKSVNTNMHYSLKGGYAMALTRVQGSSDPLIYGHGADLTFALRYFLTKNLSSGIDISYRMGIPTTVMISDKSVSGGSYSQDESLTSVNLAPVITRQFPLFGKISVIAGGGFDLAYNIYYIDVPPVMHSVHNGVEMVTIQSKSGYMKGTGFSYGVRSEIGTIYPISSELSFLFELRYIYYLGSNLKWANGGETKLSHMNGGLSAGIEYRL